MTSIAERAATPVPEPEDFPQFSHRQIMVVIGGLMIAMLLAALDQTIVATAMPTIVGELGGIDQLSWVITAYLLTSTASTPLYGKISDILGRKRVFQFAIVVFIVGSLFAAMAQSMNQLIAFRGVQGIGAGGLMALSMAIIGDIVPPRQRGRYQGYIGMSFGVASVTGPFIGGFFVEHLTWRWAFWINLPLGIAALLITGLVLKLPFRRTEHRIDYLGATLLVFTIVCVLLVTVWGGNEYEWFSRTIIGLVVAAAVGLGVFVWWERRVVEPILPPHLFRNKVIVTSSTGLFVVGIAMFGAIVFVPLFLQVVDGVSPTSSGLLMAPMMVGIIVATATSGRLITRFGRYKAFPIFGTTTLAAGIALLSTMTADTHRFVQFLFMAVVGIGVGSVMQVYVLASQNAVDPRDLGTATSTVSFFRSMGGAFGVAIYGSIFSAKLASALTDAFGPAAADQVKSSRSTPEAIKALPDDIQAKVIDAFATAIQGTFRWAIPMAVFGILFAVLLEERPLRDTQHSASSPPVDA